jgi:hypothetical protein
MMTRLVLVGMVAGLGITVPTRPEIQGWMNALHSWTACRLEAWDSSRRSDADPVRLAAPAERPGRVSEPIEPDDQTSGVAYELNRMSDGLDTRLEQAIVGRRADDKGMSIPATGRARPEFSGALTIDRMELKLMVESFLAAERSSGEGELPAAQASHRRSRKLIDPPIVCAFTTSSTTTPRVRPVAAFSATAGSQLHPSLPKTDLIEPLADVTCDIVGGLNRFAEGIDEPFVDRLAIQGGKPAFVPIDPAGTSSASQADELNRVSDGITIALAAPGERHSRRPTSIFGWTSVPSTKVAGGWSSPPRCSSEVAQAMQLTRDALHAWMKVMRGPAIVQVSAR